MLSQHLISVKESLYKLADTFFLQLTYQIFKSMAGLDESEKFNLEIEFLLPVIYY